MVQYCDRVCQTCGNFHKSDVFDCEQWGDLPEDHDNTCHVWYEGDLPHNLKYRIQKLEDMIVELQKHTKTGLWSNAK